MVFSYFTKTPPPPLPTYGYQRYLDLINNAYSSLQQVDLTDVLNESQTSLWNHKEWIMGGTAFVIATLMTRKYFKNHHKQPTPQTPLAPRVQIQSSLNCAKISIEALKEEETPPTEATLTFCIDTSGSMRTPIQDQENAITREQDVKNGIEEILTHALKIVNDHEAKIQIAIIGFAEQSTELCPPTLVNSENIAMIKDRLTTYQSYGRTEAITGLNHATTTLEMMAANKKGTHTLILLTDGDANGDVNRDTTLHEENLKGIHQRIEKVGARLFAIGIGASHNKNVLKQITNENGTYIDTTICNTSIAETISQVYKQIISRFNNLTLRSSQLPAGTWSVNSIKSTLVNGQSECPLGDLEEATKIIKTITIHPDQLEESVDLAKVLFELTFIDPKGKKGTLPLPWKPTTLITPQVFH